MQPTPHRRSSLTSFHSTCSFFLYPAFLCRLPRRPWGVRLSRSRNAVAGHARTHWSQKDSLAEELEENNAEYIKLKEDFDEYGKEAGIKEEMLLKELVKANTQLRQERELTQKLQDERVAYAPTPSPQYMRPQPGWMPMPMHGWTERGFGVV